MLLPYRVKNPTKRFPYATLSIIVLNVLVYVFTTDSLLSIKESVVENYAYALGATSFLNYFSAIFLHGDLFHLIGNMLFLWVFGRPVEDRLGVPRYLTVYLLTGFGGDLLQWALDVAFLGGARPGIGASGCIMGVVGAYWYIYSWSTVCVFYFYWIFYPRWGVWEVAAVWIVGLYVLMDVFEGLFIGSMGISGGVANFAHVGGSVVGALMCMAMRIKRDSEALSDAKAIQADMKDLSLVPLHALETMAEEDPCNPELIRAMIMPAINLSRQHVVHEAMERAGPELIDKDPGLAAHFLINLQGNLNIYKPVQVLHLCGSLERMGQAQLALAIYQLLVNAHPMAPETETALLKMAQCCWVSLKDRQKAERCLNEMARRFPNGSMAQFARTLKRQIDAS